MATGIEPARPGTIHRGEATARVELYELGRRLAGAHDQERNIEHLLHDVQFTLRRAKADLKAETTRIDKSSKRRRRS